MASVDYPDHTVEVSFDSENKAGSCPGRIVRVDAHNKFAVIVIQEWWGVNEQIRELATKLSTEFGFTTLIPDLYRGKIAVDHEHAGHLMNELDWQGAVQDIRGAAQYLKSQGFEKIGVTGFCMGGALSLASAVLVQEVEAASSFYGICPQQLADHSKVRAPILLNFGETDDIKGFSDPEAAKSLAETLKAAGATHELHIYPGVGHAFSNHRRPEVYSEQTAKLAFERTNAWFQKYLL